MKALQDQTVFISGGGPCGLSAALMFHQRGWKRIVVAEPSVSARAFDKNKGFNYLIDARGQKLLKQLNLEDELSTYGVENKRNIMTMVLSDGSHKVFKSPFWDPARDSAFWSRRENLQALLYNAIEARNDGRIELLYGHRFDGVETGGDGKVRVRVDAAEGGKTQLIEADLMLGCDGLKSTVLEAMISHSGLPQAAFDRIRHPSPSSQLHYKVMNMPAHIPLQADMQAADDNKMAYAFVSKPGESNTALAMVAYPVAQPDEPRTVNVIRFPDHKVLNLETAPDVMAFLTNAFPQLPISQLITPQEAEDFVAVKASKFPAPQYTKTCFAMLGGGEGGLPALLLGDAGHAFPPDLGLGVNSAMEDVFILSRHLDAANEDAQTACAAFDSEQAPERRALVKLVQSVAPYQYNQKPTKLKLWALQFFAVQALNKMLPFWVDKPAVLIAQQDELRFSQIRRRQVANRFKVGALIGTLGLAVAAIAV